MEDEPGGFLAPVGSGVVPERVWESGSPSSAWRANQPGSWPCFEDKRVSSEALGFGTSALRNWKMSHRLWQRALNPREGLTTLEFDTSIFRQPERPTWSMGPA